MVPARIPPTEKDNGDKPPRRGGECESPAWGKELARTIAARNGAAGDSKSEWRGTNSGGETMRQKLGVNCSRVT